MPGAPTRLPVDAPKEEHCTPSFTRLSPAALDATFNWLEAALGSEARAAGALFVRRLRTIVEESVPEHPSGPAQLGALPDIAGTVVTLQYPLMQLERFLTGTASDIASVEQAQMYLSFARYHLWKLEHLLRERAA